MISSDRDNSYKDYQSNCTKYEEYKSRIQQLEHDVTEKEDESMFWHRQFEEANEARSMGSAKTRMRRHSYLR